MHEMVLRFLVLKFKSKVEGDSDIKLEFKLAIIMLGSLR